MLNITIAHQEGWTGIYVGDTLVYNDDHYNVGDMPEVVWARVFGDHVDFTVEKLDAHDIYDRLPAHLTELRQLLDENDN